MTTYGDIIEETLSFLNSFGASRDKVTTLLNSINPSDTVLIVDDGKQVDRGYIEVDSELMFVKSVDVTSGTVTLHPWGRGERGTTAATHASNSMVTDTPRFPRFRVAQEINKTVSALYPSLFAVATDETNAVSPASVTYPVPAAVEGIVSVQYQTTGPSRMWAPVTRYKLDYHADTTAFPTGKSLDIYGGMAPGRTVKITYRKDFTQFSAETDTMASCGLDEGWRDIVVMGATARMLMGLDPSRLDLNSVESETRAPLVQPLQAAQIAKTFMANAQMRIADERRQLLMKHPTTQVRMS